MTKQVWEHDADDMDVRFGSGGFSGAGGNMQSLSFGLTSITHVLSDSPVAELPEPFYTKRYNTLRPDLDKGGCIEEGNVLMMWKGDIQE